jgi:hypothetical protein
MDWMMSIGFKQFSLMLKRPKIEKSDPKTP